MHNFFVAVEAAKGTKKTISSIFTEHFPRSSWKAPTFYENKARWNNSSQECRDRYLAAGRTDEGLWKKFAKENPSPYQELKNAQKRKARSDRNTSPLSSLSES